MSSSRKSKTRDAYGLLAAVGYNGRQPFETDGRFHQNYYVYKRKEANGKKPHKEIDLSSEQAKKAIADHHTVTFVSEKGFGSVIEYKRDTKTDLFQIGRSTEAIIDFTVVDTIPGEKENVDEQLKQSTISRYACRLNIERNPPHRACVLAAAYDNKKRIFLGEAAPQWSNGKRFSDGLTTNGVLVMHPKGEWATGPSAGIWREVSVCGEMFGLRQSRSARQRGKTTDLTNVLKDGSLIDLCGVVLLWRTPAGMSKAPTISDLTKKRELLNNLNAQCPVGLVTLRFNAKKIQEPADQGDPYVYTNCGHVHGYHVWGAVPSIDHSQKDLTYTDKRVCPFCKESGYFVALKFGMEPAFYLDNGPATHCFVPCGHVTTEATVKYWSKVLLPFGKNQFRFECPFCAVPLDGELGYTKLIFQTLAETKEIML